MKKTIKLILVMCLLLLVSVNNINKVNAATGTVTTSLTNKVIVGNKVTLKITVNCPAGVGTLWLNVNYDKNYLSNPVFTNTSAGDYTNGKILVHPTSNKSVTFTLTFTSKQVGKTDVTVSTSGWKAWDVSTVSNTTVRKSVTIEEKPEVKSTNCNLSSLYIEGYKFEEEFNSSVTEYTAYLANDVRNIKVVAKAADDKSTVSSINGDLVEGWNNLFVECTSESGNKKKYNINVYVEEKPTIFFNDGEYGVVKNLYKVEIPDGFEAKKLQLDDEEITIFNKKGINIIYLEENEVDRNFYLYDMENNGILSLFNPINVDGKEYFKTNFNYEDYSEMDDKFEQVYTIINTIEVKGWKYKADNMNQYRIVYLKNIEGNDELYSFDIKEKTLQRFTLPIEETVVDNEIDMTKIINYSCIAIGALGATLAFISVIMMTNAVKTSKNQQK